MRDGPGVVVTCEHATRQVPSQVRRLFQSAAARRALDSHRGWDPGSAELGRYLAKALDAPLFSVKASRLLVEVNRSLHHPELFSEFSSALTGPQRRKVILSYYDAHRRRVIDAIRSKLGAGRTVLHLGIHTFTPRLHGVVRNADVGLLYDPQQPRERAFCRDWKQFLAHLAPDLRIRRNYPYFGAADGLTTWLRRELNTPRYLGIELEVNQRFTRPRRRADWRRLLPVLRDSLRAAIESI